jgi:hypothetical protein
MAADLLGQLEPPLPVLDLNAPAKIAEFISTRLGLV